VALAQTAWVVTAWLRAGRFEPVVMLPLVLASRLAHAAGMAIGGLRWLRSRARRARESEPLQSE